MGERNLDCNNVVVSLESQSSVSISMQSLTQLFPLLLEPLYIKYPNEYVHVQVQVRSQKPDRLPFTSVPWVGGRGKGRY